MTYIELLDWKGGQILITFTGGYKTSDRGLVETWVYADKSWLPKFCAIPLPVFTDWF